MSVCKSRGGLHFSHPLSQGNIQHPEGEDPGSQIAAGQEKKTQKQQKVPWGGQTRSRPSTTIEHKVCRESITTSAPQRAAGGEESKAEEW